MPIAFTCPQCGATSQIDDQYAGQTGPCASCGQTISVPGVVPREGKKVDELGKKRGSGAAIVLGSMIGVLAVVCCCGGLFVALLLPALQAARETARKGNCAGHHKQIALAMHNYHDSFKELPVNLYDKDGSSYRSWRSGILPFIEVNDSGYDDKQPWNAPVNAALQDFQIDVYRCPSAASRPGDTNYLTIYSDPEILPRSIFSAGKKASFRTILDGTANTIMVVETSGAVKWVAVEDLNFQKMPLNVSTGMGATGISSMHTSGAHVSMADGSVRFLPSTISSDVLNAMITQDGGEMVAAP